MGVFSEMTVDHDDAAASEKHSILVKAMQHDEQRQEEEATAARETLTALTAQQDTTLKEPREAEKRAAHDAAEAKRKAEWEDRKRKKEEEELFAWENAVAVDDETLMQASMKRIGDDTERLTRRNMKQCVTEVVQTLCLEDLDFARQVMHPRKNMIRCFRYINRKARDYIQREMKDNDEKPVNGVYGGDVPDDLCYEWAKEYFMDMNAAEDHEGDEKFEPKPYASKYTPPKKKAEKKVEKKPQAKKKETKLEPQRSDDEPDGEQVDLFAMEGAA